jgi:hypothetical protein
MRRLPDLGIDLFGRLLADMAGVEDHQVGVFRRRGRLVAFRGQQIGHALAVVDVHLAAIALDEDAPGRSRGGFHAPELV